LVENKILDSPPEETSEPSVSEEWRGLDTPESWKYEDRRLIPTALALTVLFHLLVLFGTPRDHFLFKPGDEEESSMEYEVALVPPEPEEMRFVQTNPDVPQNEPDTERNFASRNQQAAQEDPDPLSDDDLPTLDGEMEESNQIIEGDLEEPIPEYPPPSRRENPQQNQPREESAGEERPASEGARPEVRGIPEMEPTPPAPDFIEQESESEDGPGSTMGPTGKAREVPEEELERVIPITAPLPVQSDPVEGEIRESAEEESESRQERAQPGISTPASEESPPTPRPRPRLNPNVVPAPLMRSNQSASRAGAIAVDANFSEYGDYLQRMVEAVSRAWNASVQRVELIRERPSRVKVRFTIDSRGEVSSMRVIDKTPNAQLLATGLCMDAIQSRAPYDRWTYQMVQTLGTEQEITFTFHYR